MRGIRQITFGAGGGYRYVADLNNYPAFPGSSRPLLVELDSQLGLPFAMGTTYVRPFEHGPYDLHPQDLFISQDLGTIICGNASGQGNPDAPPDGAFLLKTDLAGNVQWLNIYPDIIQFKSVIEMLDPNIPDLTIVTCGRRIEPFTGAEVAVLVRTSSAGTPMNVFDAWSNKGGGAIPGDARFIQVIQTGPNDVTLVGSANRTMNAGQLVDSDVLILQYGFSPSGVIASAVYGQTFDPTGRYGIVEQGKAIARLSPPDAGFVITGDVEAICYAASTACQPNILYKDILALRVDGNLNLTAATGGWANRYDYFSWETDTGVAVETQPGRITIAGDTGLPGLRFIALLRLDPLNGAPLPESELFYASVCCDDYAAAMVLPPQPANCLDAVIAGTTTGYGLFSRVPVVIERMPAQLGRCQSFPELPTILNVDLPPWPVLSTPSFTDNVLVPLMALPIDMAEQPICDSRLCPNGDANGDGVVNSLDAPGMAQALIDYAQFVILYPNHCNMDMNGDGFVDGDDIQIFVDLMP